MTPSTPSIATRAIELYLANKSELNNTYCTCPVCGKAFEKTKKHHSFCSNWYNTPSGQTDCKSIFWNYMARNEDMHAIIDKGITALLFEHTKRQAE